MAREGRLAGTVDAGKPPFGGDIRGRARFDDIRYSNCWEDAKVLVEALPPLDGARCLSVASAGDNSFSLLARGASLVLAADLSLAQLALVELKAVAFKTLSHDQLLRFLGIRHSAERLAVYRELRGELSDRARSVWDARADGVTGGVIHVGRFERYFRLFRRVVLPLIHGRGDVESLQGEKSTPEREAFYQAVWDNRRWRFLFRLFFGRWSMGRLGRDPAFFRFVDAPVSERILERARYALTVIPTHDNPYLHYILNGNWTEPLPDYLLPQHFDRIRRSLVNLQLFEGSVEEAAAGTPPASFHAFNLSDIFEYVDLPTYHAMLRRLLPAAAPGARFAYWNMLVPRRRPEFMADRLHPLTETATRLHRQDRAFFYQDFVLEEAR
jgi:S-adenosylmethionine-diacylglycerol 3-amino-3-carboxypropyl transferase